MKEIKFTPVYRIEDIPRPNNKVYDLLELFSNYKDKPREDLSAEENMTREALNDVYKESADKDHDLIILLSSLEGQGVISNGDKLFMACLFLTADNIGPDLKETKLMIERKKINLEVVKNEVVLAKLSSTVQSLLLSNLNKIDDYWYDLRMQNRLH
ncbi:MAG: hypothetical protein WC564_02240 [Patescibacteria group bacterium]